MDRLLRLSIVLFAAAGLAGCRPWPKSAPHGESLLKPISRSADAMELEVITIRFPLGDDELNGAAWNDIDEQQVPSSVRRELAEHGLRAGVVGGQLPPALTRMLTAAEQQPASMSEASARMEQAPLVTRQKMQLHSGWRGEIIASGIYPELPLLLRDEGIAGGRTYSQAQCVLGAKAQALGDHRVRLRLSPELQYGEPQRQWIVEDGQIRPQAGKPKRTFDRLAFDVDLQPGQMLVLTTLPSRPGLLGQYFFTEPRDGGLQQKLTVIRLADCRYNDLFAPTSLATSATDSNSIPKPTIP